MTLSRRKLTLGLAALPLLADCEMPQVQPSGPATIDARVDVTLSELYREYPGTRELAEKSVGMLVMPVITEAGFGFGGAYGRGALRVGGRTVDYYSLAKASGGLQIGAQQYAHVLFFMTQKALADFRGSAGFAVGANAQIVLPEAGETLAAETTSALAPVVVVIFGQSGIKAGATIEGLKYSPLRF